MNKDIDKRWEEGKPHHPKAEELGELIRKYDSGDQFQFGGDGDNGEYLLLILSEIFERGLFKIC